MDGRNYPVIQSVAADTTCSGGHSNQQQQDAPSSPSSTSPSSSSDDHHYSDMPPAKRQRPSLDHPLTDNSAGFMFPDITTPGRRGENLMNYSSVLPHPLPLPIGSGLSSIVHPSGRVLPVGIAQPMQSCELEQKRQQQSGGDSADETDHTSLWKGGGVGEGKRVATTHPSTSSSVEEEEEEEDVQKVMSQIETDMSSSDSDSDSSSDDDNRMESLLQQSVDHRYGNETERLPRPPVEMGRTSSDGAPPSVTSIPDLPVGKKLHVFLSHSTGDQQAVKKSIVVPLREVHRLQVVACYHCMEGQQYNDKHIERAMVESCVVVIAISPSYLGSPRYIV